MKTKNRLLTSVLCLFMVVFCVVGLTACGGDDECSHQWGEWTATTNATCTEAGVQERKCSECGETETSSINALGHDWNEATCSTPKTCKTCSATEGTANAHAYTVETVKDEALKSEANCTSAAVYYKSCSCGAISTNDADTFTSGVALEHMDENTDHVCDNNCGKNDMGTHADENKDHTCDYGCNTAIGTCEDADKDHDCDYGCNKTIGEHTDGDDNNHLCDYGCGLIADDGCYDTVVDGKCDECGADIGHTCVDENKNHACDICSATMGDHADENKDHACDYGCSNAIGSCVDTDKDHDCDYGCNKTFGICEDANKDHACDYGCSKTFGEHSDSNADDDHVCDYGCEAVLENCSDAENDGNHTCDICGNADISTHSYGNATCGTSATCSECGATTGSTLEHTDENFDHICDNNCGKNDMGTHADSNTDNDHVCDYGCGAVLENCFDVETDDDHNCDVCNKANVTAHAHVENTALATEATCDTAATKTYECNCGDTYTENDGDALGHNITGVTPAERLVDGCEYVMVYICQRGDCGEEVLGETVYHHNYVASIGTHATCSTPGQKTFKCRVCGDTSKPTEEIPADATGHNWTTGIVVDGVRTDTCPICNATKTVMVSDSNSASSNASDLANTDVQLKVDDNTNANIQLGQGVADAIGDKDITISAGVVDENTLKDMGVSDEQLGQIGANTVYDFNIKDGNGSSISDFGESNFVTITLPYTLSDGEDIDSIAVWFISDTCQVEDCDKGENCVDAHKLVSIEATYNNGFVTFQTNHFSIYTVTRLTPAERCALYGHGYVCQHVEGSCTKDAYDLYVCVRCHDKYIDEDTLVVADGHDYTPDTHAATCTENGYILYSCNDCDHSYRKKLNATGHAWSVEDSDEASCVADGYAKYSCTNDNCDEEYTITYAKLAHVYTNTIVPATCTADGYTIHDCDNCEYSYTDAYVDALGHAYESTTWAWAADYSSATLTFVCENDDEHVMALNATITTSVVNGTCSNFVKTTYTATVSYDGTDYTDEKVVELGTPDHNFSSDWTKDADEHWHECVCGEKTDVTKHIFENATTTKNPTCNEAGESTSYCVCGETKVTTIPATGDHNYVDGFCDTCGKEEVDCDHTELHRESIDFGELGACDFILYYDTCECGEVKIIDLEHSRIPCDLEQSYEEDEYVDENGNTVTSMKGVCAYCGMEVSATEIYIEDGCTKSRIYDFTFKVNGMVVIDNIGFEETWHSNTVRATIDLSEYGACGGLLIVYKCDDCGEITDIYDFYIDCNVDLENEHEAEEVTDENGVVHYILKVECPDCDLEYVVDIWVEEISICEKITHKTMTFAYGETTIGELYDSDYDDTHEYEYTYELQGETCKDGVKITKHCDICGDSYTYNRYSHSNIEYYVEIDLSEHTTCGGTINVDRCPACGYITYNNDMNINCDMSDEVEEEILDANGEVIGYKHTCTCTTCGLVFVEQEWIEPHSACEYTEYEGAYIYKGEECIFAYVKGWDQSDHEYEYTYETESNDCNDRYKVIEHCTVCGETDEWYTSGHRIEIFEMNLADHNGCEGVISGERCAICGEVTWLYYRNVGCDINGEATPDEFVDENGIAHYITTMTCPDCGLKFVADKWTVEESVCIAVQYQSTQIYKDDTLIIEYVQKSRSESHNYKYVFVMNGESCTDGYTSITTCEDCGIHYERTLSYHNIYTIFALDDEHECCDEHYLEIRSCPCGYNYYVEFYENTFTYDKELQMYVCENCDLSIACNVNSVEEGCTLIETTTIVVKLSDEVVYNYEKEKTYENHNFADVEVSVIDGVTYFTTTCDKCDVVNSTEILSAELEQHNGEYYYDYTFTPDESAKYTIIGLADGDTYVELYKSVNGQLFEIGRNDDGGYGLQFLLSADLTAGTTYVYRIGYLRFDEEGIIRFALTQGAASETVCQHNSTTDFSVLLDGSGTCEDGVFYGRICTTCGCNRYIRVEYQHTTVVKDRVDLSEHGACYGEFVYYSCACGQKQRMDYLNACYDTWTDNEYYDEEGRLIDVDVRTCSECGLRYTRSYYTVRDHENCTLTYYYTVVINIGDSLVAEMEYSVVEVAHDYEITGTLISGVGSSCEDGVVITRKCKDCEQEESYEAFYHRTYEKEHIDLSELGSVCGGYATVYGCACGERVYLNLDHSLCELGIEWCELWVEDAITEGQYTINGWNSFGYDSCLYICAVTDPEDAACAYKIRYARYWLKDENSCMAYCYETWQFGYNKETGAYAYEVTFKTGSSVYHNYVYGSTGNCVKYDCVDCGSYYYGNSYYNENGYPTKTEIFAQNTLANNGNARYYELIREWSYDDSNDESYVSRVYEKYIYADNSERWREDLIEKYAGIFGDDGRKVTSSSGDAIGETYREEYAYVWYKGCDFRIYTHRIEGDSWCRYDYTYSFDNGCVQKEVYTDSDGASEENTNDICRFWNRTTIKNPTCTQDGEQCRECVVCGKHTGSYTVSPHDHVWVQVTDNWYFCFTCGLENANGVSGDIIMEDLTETYGNGEYYVVGYYARNNVEFSQYVSLILADGTEVAIWSGIDFTTIDGIRAYAISKAAVEAWATENGYTDYDVRFSFVPVGSDGSFDYGVTFTEPTVVTDTISDNVSFTDYIGARETKSYTITPTEDGVWIFTSFADGDTYATLCDAEGNVLTEDDDGGNYYNNFKMTYELKAGETYIINVRWYVSRHAGEVPLFFGTAPVTA